MINTAASAASSAAPTGKQKPWTARCNPRNFHELWKVPFTEYRDVYACELGINRFRKAIASLMALLKIVSNGPYGAISRRLSQTVKHTAYTENMYIAYLLSLVACQLNGLDYQCEAEVLHRRALCIGIRCIGGNNPLLADSMEWLAFSLYRQGNYKEAQLLCRSALFLLQTSLGTWHPHTGNCYLNLSVVLETQGVRHRSDGTQQKGKTVMSVPQPSYYTSAVEQKGVYGRPGEILSKPDVSYINSAYIFANGLRGLSVS